jgi:hypothetical protein
MKTIKFRNESNGCGSRIEYKGLILSKPISPSPDHGDLSLFLDLLIERGEWVNNLTVDGYLGRDIHGTVNNDTPLHEVEQGDLLRLPRTWKYAPAIVVTELYALTGTLTEVINEVLFSVYPEDILYIFCLYGNTPYSLKETGNKLSYPPEYVEMECIENKL